MCCNIHGLILYLAKVALVAVELCEFALVSSFFFRCCFSSVFLSVFSLLSASLQAGFSAFEMLPLFTLRSSRITYNNCWKLKWASRPRNTIQNPSTKSNNHSDNSLTIFTKQIFTGQLFSFTITSMLSLGALCFYFLSKKRNLPYGRWSGFLGDHKTALLSLRRAYCICGACDRLWSPGPPECAFSMKDQTGFFFNSLCCLCM